MNITVLCIWGILCLLNGVFSVIGLILPFIAGVVQVQVLNLIATICVPVSYFLGAVFAVHLYHVAADEADVGTIPGADKLDKFGHMFDKTDPYNAKELGGAVSEVAHQGYQGIFLLA